MSTPPPPGTPPGAWDQLARMLQAYYQACQSGSTAAAQQNVQQIEQTVAQQGPTFMENLRQLLASMQSFIRPALIAAGAAWTTVTTVGAQVGAFVMEIGASIVGALLSVEFLLFMLAIAVLVLLFWWMWHKQREEFRAAGYPQAMHSPEDGFPAGAVAAAEFRHAARAPMVGALEVIEGRARWEMVHA